jgi:hypothetical protein
MGKRWERQRLIEKERKMKILMCVTGASESQVIKEYLM